MARLKVTPMDWTVPADWRYLDPERERFFTWADEALRRRVLQGAREHGNVFQGNPLEHAIEKALDLLFYLWLERRKQIYEN